jgi:D-glycero-D-manno-heptose 1,7-bisphosphate phosphatase
MSRVAPRRRAVFLDRDGVLLEAPVAFGRPRPPASLEEMRVLSGVPEALRALRDAGFLLIVATNQPDVARGVQSRGVVEAMHDRLRATLPLDDVRVCLHDDDDGCACRKPAPGLLLDAARDHGVALDQSYFVGDRWRDVEAGARAGCASVFVDRGYAERAPGACAARVSSLPEATAWILSASRPDAPGRSAV